jgi:hypothetical protein
MERIWLVNHGRNIGSIGLVTLVSARNTRTARKGGVRNSIAVRAGAVKMRVRAVKQVQSNMSGQ